MIRKANKEKRYQWAKENIDLPDKFDVIFTDEITVYTNGRSYKKMLLQKRKIFSSPTVYSSD